MGSRSPLEVLDANLALRSPVRCLRGKAAIVRSSTLLSMEMVSGSYAARLIAAAQDMATNPLIPTILCYYDPAMSSFTLGNTP